MLLHTAASSITLVLHDLVWGANSMEVKDLERPEASPWGESYQSTSQSWGYLAD